MKQVLFVVRLHPSFRFWELPYQLGHDDRSIMRRFPEVAALFPTRAHAVQFSAMTLPIGTNPFAVDYWTAYADDEVLTLNLYDPDWLSNPFDAELRDFESRRNFDVEEFSKSVEEQGFSFLKPSEWDTPLAWQTWWEETTRNYSENQKQQLRKEWRLPNWRPNPFDTETIHLEWQDSWLLWLDNKHEVLKEELSDLAVQLSVPILDLDAELALYHWWEKSASKLSAEAREKLWRLLCPHPWEIVEVPLG
ncbi:hypothetical protein [Armatimonas sp.]|uniref:hypothetical protein n=1 Tax=Armatimonas sp. TaxID=1872638 RepID=UPI00286B528C|nr:hypothetical protein [Armatimonas sp.]